MLRRLCLLALVLAAGFARAEDGTGKILRDFWLEIEGTKVSDLTSNPDFPKSPSGSNQLEIFEAPTDWNDNYGTLVRGYVHPPVSGKYTFYIASDDNSELWLSTSDDPAKKVKIGQVSEWTPPRDWNHNPEQKSPPIPLEAGKKYYIEAIHKEGGGGDNLAVGWVLPDGKEERPIPGKRLSPFAAKYEKRVYHPPPPPPPPPTAAGHWKQRFDAKVGEQVIKVPYLLFLPDDYFKTQEKYPMIVFMHGAGECGTDLEAVSIHGPASMTKSDEKFRKNFKFIGFYPQSTPNRRWDSPGSITAVVQTMDTVINQYRVDKDRVYATGLSMGGKGTWMLAEEAPDRFAAIAPISAVDVQPDKAPEILKKMSIWIICGSDDGDFTNGSKKMYDVLKKGGVDAYLTVFPHEGHGVWTRYYPDPTFYEWLAKHRRGANDHVALPPSGNPIDPNKPPDPKPFLATAPNNGAPGSIFCEFWRGIGGNSVNELTSNPEYPNNSTESGFLTDFEINPNQDDNYGTRVRGFVHPPASGQYTFWISSDDNSELYLSTTDKPEQKVKIAFVGSCTAPRAWDALPEQKSKPIQLEAGRKYYIEALHKEGGGDDNLAVGWQLPDGNQERPIPGNRLSPFVTVIVPHPAPPLPEAKILGDIPTTPGEHKMKAELTMKDGKKLVMAFIVFIPNGYDKTKDNYPMFTFLHGNTHQGNDWNGLLNEGPAQYLNDIPKLRDWMPMLAYIPQCPAGERWDNRAVIRDVIAIQDEVVKRFRVDKDRVYCTGLSMGGKGTWMTVLEAPDRFAAVAPISAVAVRPNEAATKLVNVATWIICGGEDGGFAAGSREMYATLKKSIKEVELTDVPGEGHGVWGRYYPNQKFYEWLLKHRRPAAPAVKDPAQTQAPVQEKPAVVAQAPAAPTPPTPPAPVAVTPAKPAAPAATAATVAATTATVTKPQAAIAPAIPVTPPVEARLDLKPSAGPYVATTLSLGAVFLALAVYFFVTGSHSLSPVVVSNAGHERKARGRP